MAMKKYDPATTGRISQLNHEGDTKYSWDRNNELEVAAAKEHFDSLRAKGFLVFKVKFLGLRRVSVDSFDKNAGKYIFSAPEMVTEFTPEADYVVSPQMSGG